MAEGGQAGARPLPADPQHGSKGLERWQETCPGTKGMSQPPYPPRIPSRSPAIPSGCGGRKERCPQPHLSGVGSTSRR